MISSQRIPPIAILYIFIGPFRKYVNWEGGRSRRRKHRHRRKGVQSKKWISSHKFFHELFSVIESFPLGSSWSSGNITSSNKKSTSKKESTCVSEISKKYLHKNIIESTTLLMWGVYKYISVSKNVFKDVIFYLRWYNVTCCGSYTCKKYFSSHSIVS